jgi:DNA-binding protein HU-beta
MNKKELIEIVADTTGFSKVAATRAVGTMLDAIERTLMDGGTVILTNFGKFEVRGRAARKGRNPATGEPMEIMATKVPVFKPGKAFKTAIKNN